MRQRSIPFTSWRFLRALLCSLPLVCGEPLLKAQTEQGTAPQAADRSDQLGLMRARAETLRATARIGEDQVPLPLSPKPILNYSAPAGETTDGTFWTLGAKGRPAALVSVFFYESTSATPKWSCELVSLAEHPIEVNARPGWKWIPGSSGIRWAQFPEAPEPATTDVRRTRQMRDLARRITASETIDDRVDELRLMPQPLHRYSDPEHDLIDGAIFAYASGTNPEAGLLVECRKAPDGELRWHYGLFRMTAAEAFARLDESEVWRCSPIKTWDKQGPYFSMFGTEAQVFGPGI